MSEAAPKSPWLAGACAGDGVAFDRLVRPMLGNLRALCLRLMRRDSVADELLQETLIRAHRGITEFRAECSFRSWIVSILYRLATEPARFDSARPLPGQSSLEAVVPEQLAGSGDGNDPLVRVTARDLLHRVEEAMERLPVRQRTALHLRAVEGWDYEEIARALETTPGASRMAVLNARRRLRERLGDVL